MSLSRSIANGASSLQAHQRKLDVISNNIANANTVGYKSSRANFAEQFNQLYSNGNGPDNVGVIGNGGINPKQMGLGVKLSSISMDMGQGTLETTSRSLDLALQGDGFFVFNNNNTQVYSRAGAITRDKSGNFVDTNSGAFLQGFNLLPNSTKLDNQIKNLNVSQSTISAPRQTQNINMSGNLNSLAATGAQYATSISVFDNEGAAHTLNVTFTKTANANEFSLTGTLDGNNVTLPVGAGGTTTILFNNDGTIANVNGAVPASRSLAVTGTELNTALGPNVNVFDATKNLSVNFAADANNLLSGLTQVGSPNSANMSNQDGYASGTLTDLTVDPQGKIWGAFTNGQSQVLGQVLVAKFTNPTGLIKQGNNFYTDSPNSGLANIGTAGENFPSTSISGYALEQSNVEMTEQFTEMIAAQRGFEAAARTVTVSDQLLGETNNLKR